MKSNNNMRFVLLSFTLSLAPVLASAEEASILATYYKKAQAVELNNIPTFDPKVDGLQLQRREDLIKAKYTSRRYGSKAEQLRKDALKKEILSYLQMEKGKVINPDTDFDGRAQNGYLADLKTVEVKKSGSSCDMEAAGKIFDLSGDVLNTALAQQYRESKQRILDAKNKDHNIRLVVFNYLMMNKNKFISSPKDKTGPIADLAKCIKQEGIKAEKLAQKNESVDAQIAFAVNRQRAEATTSLSAK